MKEKVLLTEPIYEEGVEILEEEAEVVRATAHDEGTIREEIGDCAGVIIRKAHITEEIIDSAPKLKVIAKHGVGVDNIALDAAEREGITVVNAPKSNIHSVAEHTLGLTLAVAKNLINTDREVRERQFETRDEQIGTEIRGKMVGIIGLGTIGQLLVRLLQPFGVEVLAFDAYQEETELEVELVDNIEEIYLKADIISLHVPLKEETEGMVGAEEFNMMKDSAIFINAARGGLVREGDLVAALKSGEIKGAGLDVYKEEPPSADNPLFELENVVLSPHNAALTEAAMRKMATGSARGVVDVLRGNEPKYRVI